MSREVAQHLLARNEGVWRGWNEATTRRRVLRVAAVYPACNLGEEVKNTSGQILLGGWAGKSRKREAWISDSK